MQSFKRQILLSIFIIVLILNFSCTKNEKISITNLNPYTDIDGMGQKYRYFLVQNFHFKNKEQFEEIRKFAQKNVDSDFAKYSGYIMVFYRESSETPVDFKQTESNLILWHGKDIIYTFEWSYGKFYFYNAYKDDEIIK